MSEAVKDDTIETTAEPVVPTAAVNFAGIPAKKDQAFVGKLLLLFPCITLRCCFCYSCLSGVINPNRIGAK